MSWYRESFGLDYLDVYPHRDAAEGEFEAARIVRMLGLAEGDRVLDVACGNGRHAAALARLGLRPVGIDLSMDLLRAAAAAGASCRTGSLPLARADMRRLPFRPAFDAALSLFTSFGYFEDEDDDRAVLCSVAGVLKKGGAFLLDFLNEKRVRSTLVPRSEEVRGERRIVQERRVSPDGRRVDKTIRILHRDRRGRERVLRESVRLYRIEQLAGMLDACGLRVARAFGSFRGEPHAPDSPRLILLARKTP